MKLVKAMATVGGLTGVSSILGFIAMCRRRYSGESRKPWDGRAGRMGPGFRRDDDWGITVS